MIVGTAAVLAVAAVIALAIATVLRRSAAAVATVIVVTVLPYLLTVAVPILPLGPADWLARVSPAAGFAVQQTLIQYPQVSNVYAPRQATGRWPRGPASRCCVPGPWLPWRWPRTCCVSGTHERRARRAQGARRNEPCTQN